MVVNYDSDERTDEMKNERERIFSFVQFRWHAEVSWLRARDTHIRTLVVVALIESHTNVAVGTVPESAHTLSA